MATHQVRRPEWIRIKSLPSEKRFFELKDSLRSLQLNTVCEEARCPNITECWESGTATIMIMGDSCSRRCKFCSVKNGRMSALDPDEPLRVAVAINNWAINYVVVTSVCRDDLMDGGAEHFAKTIRAIRSISGGKIAVEPLVPDFQGKYDSLETIVKSRPQIISHNIETIRRLSSKIRDIRASYDLSLRVLRIIKEINPQICTKSSLMLGLGETQNEVVESLVDLKAAGVDVITMGQYLQPTLGHIPVAEYIPPAIFERYKQIAYDMGYRFVAAGPFVRSSYKAGEMSIHLRMILD